MGKASKSRSADDAKEFRTPVPPEQSLINVRRQAPTYPGADGEEEAEDISRNEQPGNVPDEPETGPIFDRTEEPPPTFYSEEAEPDAMPDDVNEVEVRHRKRTPD